MLLLEERPDTLLTNIIDSVSELAHRIESEEDFGDLGELAETTGNLHQAINRLICVLIVRGEDREDFDFSVRGSKSAVAHALGISGRRLGQMMDVAQNVVSPTQFQRDFMKVRKTPLPTTARFFRDNEIGFDACRVIRDLINSVEASVERDLLEVNLATAALHMSPDMLRAHGVALIQALGMGSNKEDREERRNVGITEQGPDLMSRLFGEVDDKLATLLRRLFCDYAKPGALLPEGADDTRTQGQRQHDALVAALVYALQEDGPLKPKRGAASIVATMTLDQLEAMTGVTMTDVGTVIDIEDMLKLGASKHWYLAILDGEAGNLLHLSRTKRTADAAMYHGLFAAQGGDQTPGSRTVAAQSEIHHAVSWALGGETTADNLVMVAPWTHRKIDDYQEDPSKYWTEVVDGRVYFREPDTVNRKRHRATNFNPLLYLNPGYQIRHAKNGRSRSWFAHITNSMDRWV